MASSPTKALQAPPLQAQMLAGLPSRGRSSTASHQGWQRPTSRVLAQTQRGQLAHHCRAEPASRASYDTLSQGKQQSTLGEPPSSLALQAGLEGRAQLT